MRLRLNALTERLRASLFLLPMGAVFTAIAVGLVTLAIDNRFDSARDLPFGFASTVESARAVLATIAGATISFAGIAFSVSLLVIQLASSQYSPRVVHTLFRDPFNKRVMALVVGTFTYCVIVLRSVRSPLEDGGEAVIPNLSVAVAVLLGIAAVLALIAFIDHNAHTMDVSEILDRVTGEAVRQIRKEWPERGTLPPTGDQVPVPEVFVVRFDRSGWVQQIDIGALADCAPDVSDIALYTAAGQYAIDGAVLCSLASVPADPDGTERAIRNSVVIGKTRTAQQDVSYGIRQLADVALRALSPGVNDPTTAQDAIFHLTAVLAEALRRSPPASIVPRASGGRLLLTERPGHVDLVVLGYDEIRRAAADQPAVCIYLLESLRLLREASGGRLPTPVDAAVTAQAGLVVTGCEHADLLAADLDAVQSAHRSRFGSVGRNLEMEQ